MRRLHDLGVDRDNVQGNILEGFRTRFVRHLVLTVVSRNAARQWLRDAVTGGSVPQVCRATEWSDRPSVHVNVGITYQGLVALGLPEQSLATFPAEFRAGMVGRAAKLGDVGPSAPEHWAGVLGRPDLVHVIVTVYADDWAALHEVRDRVAPAFMVRQILDGERLDGKRLYGERFDGDYVHFGYRDSIAQPRFAEDGTGRGDQPLAPVGTVLLGHRTAFGELVWKVPEPFGADGTFNAFRVLAQDVVAFEKYLDAAADVLRANNVAQPAVHYEVDDAWRELVKAKLLGRWRDGTPLQLPKGGDPLDPAHIDDFDYQHDSDGLNCPVGAHIRRSNPRSALIVQRSATYTRRLVRRGMPYGRPYAEAPDDDRGLLGNFLCASLVAQFEAIQYDWVNLGFQDPRLTGTNDPLIGNNDPDFSRFLLPVDGQVIELEGFPRFTTTRGGAYTFWPSIAWLRNLV